MTPRPHRLGLKEPCGFLVAHPPGLPVGSILHAVRKPKPPGEATRDPGQQPWKVPANGSPDRQLWEGTQCLGPQSLSRPSEARCTVEQRHCPHCVCLRP